MKTVFAVTLETDGKVPNRALRQLIRNELMGAQIRGGTLEKPVVKAVVTDVRVRSIDTDK